MKKIIRLTESELTKIIKKVIIESNVDPEIEEGWLSDKLRDAGRGIKKITTGKKTHPREYFIDDLLDIEDEVYENPDDFVDGDNWEYLKRDLITKAYDSNFTGELVKKQDRFGKTKIDYEIPSDKITGIPRMRLERP